MTRCDFRRDSSEIELAGGTKLLNKVTACKVNSSSGAEQLALFTEAR